LQNIFFKGIEVNIAGVQKSEETIAKELVPLKQVVKLRRDLSANDTSRHPKLLKIGPNHQCQ